MGCVCGARLSPLADRISLPCCSFQCSRIKAETKRELRDRDLSAHQSVSRPSVFPLCVQSQLFKSPSAEREAL